MKYTKSAIEEMAALYRSDRDSELQSLFATLTQTNRNAVQAVSGDNPLTIEITTREVLFEKKFDTENKVFIAFDNVNKSDIYLIKVIKAAKKDRVRRLIIRGSISKTCYYILEKFVRNNTDIREIRLLNNSNGNGDLSNFYQLRFVQTAILTPTLVALELGDIALREIAEFVTTLKHFEHHLMQNTSDQVNKRASSYPLFITFSNAQSKERFFLLITHLTISSLSDKKNEDLNIKRFLGIYTHHLHTFKDGQDLLEAIPDDNLMLASYILSHQAIFDLIPAKDFLQPLQDVVKQGRLDMLKLIFSSRDLLNQFTCEDEQNFFKAAIESNQIEAVNLLLKFGLIPKKLSLKDAVKKQRYKIAIALINGGAKVSANILDSVDYDIENANELKQLIIYIKTFFAKITTHDQMSAVVIEFQEICEKEKYASKDVIYNWREIGTGHSALCVAAQLQRYKCMVQLSNLYFRSFVKEAEILDKAYETEEYLLLYPENIEIIPSIVSKLTSKPRHYHCRPMLDALLRCEGFEDFSPILKAALRLKDFYTHLDTAIQDPTVTRFCREVKPEAENIMTISDKKSYEDAIKSSITYEFAKAVYKMLVKEGKIDEDMQKEASKVIRVVKDSKRLHPTIIQAVDNNSDNHAELIVELVSRVAHLLVSDRDLISAPDLLKNFYRSFFLLKCNSIFEEAKPSDALDPQLKMLVENSLKDNANMKRIHFRTRVRSNPVPALLSIAGFAGVFFFAKRHCPSEESPTYGELIAPVACLSTGVYSLYKQYHSSK